MSVNINYNYKPPTNLQKWKTLQNGAFAIIGGNAEHPFPKGLYRIFIVRDPSDVSTESIETDIASYILIPMFDGPFTDGLFPYMLPLANEMPELINKVSQIHIDVEFT